MLAGAFVAIAVLPSDKPALGVLAFGLAGLGCSALLPLTISFGQEELVAISAAVAGGVIAFYQLGYGIAAFGAGPLQDAGVDAADHLRLRRHRRGGDGHALVPHRPTGRHGPYALSPPTGLTRRTRITRRTT